MVHLLLIVIYIAFIGLGLPDSLLGSAWPSMYPDLGVPVSYAGIISMTIAIGTIVSSLMTDRLTKRFDTGMITAISVAMTAVAILGFSLSTSFWMLWLWAIPYGLGAGSVDAALNNYVAVHYPSRHMSWLHCMWGIGTIIGPNIISCILTGGGTWNEAYRYMFFIQIALTAVLVISLPLWKKNGSSDPAVLKRTLTKSLIKENRKKEKSNTLSFRKILSIPGAKAVMVTFFCYCALEQTTALWASSYMVLHNGISAETAASYVSMFYIGITIGRAVNGFLTYRFTDTQMIRAGQVLAALGIIALLLPFGSWTALVGLILIGLGCAPIYPCLIHSTPDHFGEENSQALMGVEMASAYVGTCLMPPLYGLISENISASLLPLYLTLILVLMIVMHEILVKKSAVGKDSHSA